MKFVIPAHKTNLQNYFLIITLPHERIRAAAEEICNPKLIEKFKVSENHFTRTRKQTFSTKVPKNMKDTL